MIEALIENPILLFFLVVGIGYGVGGIRVRGFGLVVAAILFTGLVIGSLSPDLSRLFWILQKLKPRISYQIWGLRL